MGAVANHYKQTFRGANGSDHCLYTLCIIRICNEEVKKNEEVIKKKGN